MKISETWGGEKEYTETLYFLLNFLSIILKVL